MLPPQVSAPSALEDAVAILLGGDAQLALDRLQPLFTDIEDSEKTLSARTLVAGWIVMGHCVALLPENGDDLLASMQQWTSRLESAAVDEAAAARSVTSLAEGVHYKAFGDFEAAIVSFRSVSESAGPWQALAILWLAEATLNSAYSEDGTGIDRPEKIDDARPLYEQALRMSSRDIVRGLANEGLSIVAELKRDRSEACEFASAALAAYQAAGASQYRLESPQITLKKNRCD